MAKLGSTQVYGDLIVDGEIKNKASTTTEGVVQLVDSASDTSTNKAPTANALKGVNDDLSTHKTDATSHITATERNTWNGKANASHLHTIDNITDIAVGTCSTAAATAAKAVTVTNFVLRTGAIALIKFTSANTATSATLNINSTGAKPIYYNGAAVPKDLIVANDLITFVYDGTNWVINGVLDYGTTTTTLTNGGTGVVGSSSKMARADHTHTMPSCLPVAGGTVTGNLGVSGTADFVGNVGFNAEVYMKVGGVANSVNTLLYDILTKKTFSCTAKTGYTIVWQYCYFQNNEFVANLRMKRTDGGYFPSSAVVSTFPVTLKSAGVCASMGWSLTAWTEPVNGYCDGDGLTVCTTSSKVTEIFVTVVGGV